jgi:hypothetical protein
MKEPQNSMKREPDFLAVFVSRKLALISARFTFRFMQFYASPVLAVAASASNGNGEMQHAAQ